MSLPIDARRTHWWRNFWTESARSPGEICWKTVSCPSGEESLTGEVPQGGVLERPEQPTSPAGGLVEAPLAGSSSLQQHEQSRHGVTPAVTRAGNAARSLRERSANDSAHLAEIATDSTLSELRRLGLYTKALLPNVVHQTNKAESVVEYACATTNVQRYSVGEKMEVIPNSYSKHL